MNPQPPSKAVGGTKLSPSVEHAREECIHAEQEDDICSDSLDESVIAEHLEFNPEKSATVQLPEDLYIRMMTMIFSTNK